MNDPAGHATTPGTAAHPAASRLTPELRWVWVRALLLCTVGLALAVLPGAGRLRKLAAAVLGGLGLIGLFFGVAETTAPPATVRRKVRPLRDMVSLFLR